MFSIEERICRNGKTSVSAAVGRMHGRTHGASRDQLALKPARPRWIVILCSTSRSCSIFSQKAMTTSLCISDVSVILYTITHTGPS